MVRRRVVGASGFRVWVQGHELGPVDGLPFLKFGTYFSAGPGLCAKIALRT